MAIFGDLMAAIPAYTGLSPVSFFTVVALLITLYYLVSGFFAAPKHTYVPMQPLPPPVQLGDVSEEELRAYDGTDPSKPLLMAIKGQIYDVSQSRMFYGPGGPYALFAGKDASRALAKMSFEEQDLTGNIEGLSAYEVDGLQDWEWRFMNKYVKVGQIPSKETKSREVDVADVPSEAQENENVTKVSEDIAQNEKVTKASEDIAQPVASEVSEDIAQNEKVTKVSEDITHPVVSEVSEDIAQNEKVTKVSEDIAQPVASEETKAAE